MSICVYVFIHPSLFCLLTFFKDINILSLTVKLWQNKKITLYFPSFLSSFYSSNLSSGASIPTSFGFHDHSVMVLPLFCDESGNTKV
jgi:hypothetical protein